MTEDKRIVRKKVMDLEPYDIFKLDGEEGVIRVMQRIDHYGGDCTFQTLTIKGPRACMAKTMLSSMTEVILLDPHSIGPLYEQVWTAGGIPNGSWFLKDVGVGTNPMRKLVGNRVDDSVVKTVDANGVIIHLSNKQTVTPLTQKEAAQMLLNNKGEA